MSAQEFPFMALQASPAAPNPRRLQRGGVALSTTVTIAGVAMVLGGIILSYSVKINQQTSLHHDVRVASLKAKSGIEHIRALLRNNTLDPVELVQSSDIEAQAFESLEDFSCGSYSDHIAATLYITPEQLAEYNARLVAMDYGIGLDGGGVLPWLMIESEGQMNDVRKVYVTYVEPVVLDTSTIAVPHVPMFLFGLASVRQLKPNQSLVFDAFDARTDNFTFTAPWGGVEENPRPLGDMPGKIMSMGQIKLKGEWYAEAATPFDYEHNGSSSAPMTEWNPWSSDYLDPETGLFKPENYTSATADSMRAFSLEKYGAFTGNVSMRKGNAYLDERSTLNGTLYGGQTALGKKTFTGSSAWKSAQHTGEVENTDSNTYAHVTLDDGTKIKVNQDLFDLFKLDAQYLASEKGAGQFDEEGNFTQGNFEVAPDLLVANEAQLRTDQGTWGAVSHPKSPTLSTSYTYFLGNTSSKDGLRAPWRTGYNFSGIWKNAEYYAGNGGVYTFENLKMTNWSHKLKIDASSGPITIYVEKDLLLSKGDVEIVGDHPVKIIQGGYAGTASGAPAGMRSNGAGLLEITIPFEVEGDLSLQGETIKLGSSMTAKNFYLHATGEAVLGKSSSAWAEIEVAENAHISAAGPARETGEITYGNINFNYACLNVCGDMKVEAAGALASAGTKKATGVMTVSNDSEIVVQGDLLVDARGINLKSSSYTEVNGEVYFYARDAFTMANSAQLASNNAAARIFVNLDGAPGIIGGDGTGTDLDEGNVRLCHCDDAWVGIYAPNSYVYIHHDIGLFGSVFGGYLYLKDLTRMRQDKSLHDVKSSEDIDYSIVGLSSPNEGPSAGSSFNFDFESGAMFDPSTSGLSLCPVEQE